MAGGPSSSADGGPHTDICTELSVQGNTGTCSRASPHLDGWISPSTGLPSPPPPPTPSARLCFCPYKEQNSTGQNRAQESYSARVAASASRPTLARPGLVLPAGTWAACTPRPLATKQEQRTVALRLLITSCGSDAESLVRAERRRKGKRITSSE